MDGGVLGVWSSTESSPFVDAMKRVFADVRVEKVTVWNNLIEEEQTDWLVFGVKNLMGEGELRRDSEDESDLT